MAAVVANAAAGAPKLTSPALLLVSNPHGFPAETQVLVAPSENGTGFPIQLPTWAVALYVPSGYSIDLGLPPGTPVGGVFADSQFGVMTAGDPSTVTDTCVPGRHAAVWTADLTVDGAPLPIRLFIDPTSGDETGLGAYRLSFCESDIPRFVFEALTAPSTTGLYMWRAFLTPPGPHSVDLDPTGTYELRSVVPIPHVIQVKAQYLRRWKSSRSRGWSWRARAASPVPGSSSFRAAICTRSTGVW